MTTPSHKRVFRTMKTSTEFISGSKEPRLVPNAINTFAIALSGNFRSMPLGLGAGASQ